MVQLRVRLGPKGQVVIPKIFRNEFKLYQGEEVILEEEENGILITSPQKNIVEELEKIAKTIKKELSQEEINKLKEEQYEDRTRRAGIKSR